MNSAQGISGRTSPSPLALGVNSLIQESVRKMETEKKTCELAARTIQRAFRAFRNFKLEGFKEKLTLFNSGSCNDDVSKIAKYLVEIIPAYLSTQEVLNFIFEKADKHEIPYLLEAMLQIDPTFSLSPFDRIRRKIVEDRHHVLTNKTLIAMLKEQGIDQEEKIDALYDLAYRMNHPYIYPLSSAIVPPNAYTLNFIWVNLNPQDRREDRAENIFKDGLDQSENADCIKYPEMLRRFETVEKDLKEDELNNWEKTKKSFTYRLSKWADQNPGVKINLWYDRALVTEKAQTHTDKMMRALSKSREVDLKLRDIRQLPNVTGEIENALHPGVHIYFRVDLLKSLIADYMLGLRDESAKYCVVSHVDVEPMPPEQMFDKRTLGYLDSAGYVFNRNGFYNFENNFFIFNKENQKIRKVHSNTIIKSVTDRIKELRSYTHYPSDDQLLCAHTIYDFYQGFRQEMQERNTLPRKVVASQYSWCNGSFNRESFRGERFRFIGTDPIPYVRYGRNFDKKSDAPIDSLTTWKALSLVAPSNS